ncbi:MAG: CYTH domain-containing protein [Alphaproteobacteria bacterium]
MQIEFEAKWIEFPDNLREILKEKGFVNTKEKTLYKRTIFHFPETDKSKNLQKWGRVRDEGNVITLTVKEFHSNSLDGVKEIELKVDSYENAISFMKAVDLEPVSYQETTREIWEKGDAEVVFDQWPGLPFLIEVEGKSEEDVKITASELGLNWKKAYFGAIDILCEDVLGIPANELNNISEITFEKPLKKRN